ncbi:MAG: phage portal protein [Acidobacteriota bacterium]
MAARTGFLTRALAYFGVRRIEAASDRRWTGGASPRFGSYSSETNAVSETVRAKSRALAVNNPWIANGVAAWSGNTIGAGIVPTSQHPEPETRKVLDAAFKRWCATCDLDGRTDFYGLQAGMFRGTVVDGEAFIQFVTEPDGLRLQLIPAELIDHAETRELGGGARIIAGIEFDARGRRVAYHVRPLDPSAIWESYAPPVRVSALDMVQLCRPLGPGQVRGLSWLAPILLRAGELDQLEDAALVANKVAAMHAGFLTDQNGAATGFPVDGTQIGSIMESGLEPGTLRVLPSGFDIKFSAPQQSAQLIDFAKLQLRGIAAGLGVPEYLLTGDLSNANYSSLRAGLIEFRARIEAVQFQTLVPQLLQPVWERFIVHAVLTGEIDAPDFEARMPDYFACEWIPPAQAWVDPEKDAKATAAMIASGLTSRRRAVAAQGYSVEELDAEIISDRQRETGLGLSFGPETTNA